MNEIYWITRLDSINTLTLALMVLSITISAIVTIVYYGCNGQKIYDEAYTSSESKEYRGYMNTCKNVLKYSLPIAIISSLLTVFIPTTKEALLIYGIGGTIDYIKSNPTAKQIPDKCITALDKWVSSLSNDSTENKK